MLVERETTRAGAQHCWSSATCRLRASVARRFASTAERQDDLAPGRRARARPGGRPPRSGAARRVSAPTSLRCVEGELRRHLRDRSSPVRVPRSLQGDSAGRSSPPSRPRRRRLGQATAGARRRRRPDRSAPVEELSLDRALVARAAGRSTRASGRSCSSGSSSSAPRPRSRSRSGSHRRTSRACSRGRS